MARASEIAIARTVTTTGNMSGFCAKAPRMSRCSSLEYALVNPIDQAGTLSRAQIEISGALSSRSYGSA